MVKRAIQPISTALPPNLQASDPELSSGWWRYHKAVVLSPYEREPTGEKEKKKTTCKGSVSNLLIRSFPQRQQHGEWRAGSRGPPAPHAAAWNALQVGFPQPCFEGIKARRLCGGHLFWDFLFSCAFSSWMWQGSFWCYSSSGPASCSILLSTVVGFAPLGVLLPFLIDWWKTKGIAKQEGFRKWFVWFKPCLCSNRLLETVSSESHVCLCCSPQVALLTFKESMCTHNSVAANCR